MKTLRSTKNHFGRTLVEGRILVFLLLSTAIWWVSPNKMQAQNLVLDNLTGGTSQHTSCIGTFWTPHEWDIIFPVAFHGSSIDNPILYYRLWSTETSTIVNGGFTTGDDGGFVVTPVNATRVSNFTPPGTNQPDEYYCFDFTGQTLVVPANGILWFRFDGLNGSCSQARRDIGALGTYTTTYQQQNFTRSGGTSFIIFGNDGCSVDNEPPVVSCPPDQSNIPCSDWPGSLAAWTANHPAPVNGVDFENQGGTVTDNCSADVDISVSVVDSDNGGSVCSGPVLVVSRTYTLTDESGNQSVCTQTFTFNQDQGPPVFAEAPGELDITIAVTTQDYCHNQPAYYIIN